MKKELRAERGSISEIRLQLLFLFSETKKQSLTVSRHGSMEHTGSKCVFNAGSIFL